MEIVNLHIDNCEQPLGVDTEQPRFSWQVKTRVPNWKQQAYAIKLYNKDVCLWNSGKIYSNKMTDIAYEGEKLPEDSHIKICVTVWDCFSNCLNAQSHFHTGIKKSESWQGSWIGEDGTQHKMFRKSFIVPKKAIGARVYICGLGHYSAYINGKPITQNKLTPGWTDYNKSCIYNVYEVSSLLNEGENVIGVILGDGMFHAPEERYVYYSRSYGFAKLLVQLNMDFDDGTVQTVFTNEQWLEAKSPYTFCSMYAGEDYDARLEQKGCFEAGFVVNSSWQNAKTVKAPKGKLVSRLIPPIQVKECYEASNIIKLDSNSYLYDFGKNFSGWVKISLDNARDGNVVLLEPGEIIDENNNPDQRVTGKGYHWKYTANNDLLQEYCPCFTYIGFRYVKVIGAVPKGEENPDSLPVISKIQGEFLYASEKPMGEFSCSVPLYNDIHSIVLQAIKSNTKSLFTDCPHRERLGWLEQTHLIGPSILYNLSVRNIYDKIAQDMVEAQRDNGLIPDIAPEYVVFGYHEGFVDSPEWGSALILNAWYLYKRYGTIATVQKHYEAMKRYTLYLESRTHHHVLHHGLGDWLDIGPCTPYSQNTPVPVVATSIFYYIVTRMAIYSQWMNNKDDENYFTQLAENVFEEYNAQFYDKETGRYATGSQAAQALGLITELVPKAEQEKVFKYLCKDIIARNYAVTAGDIGHPFVLAALTKYGKSDIIAEMTLVTDKPGYGYQVKCGATTLTEEWDGPEPNNPHGSQNHLMLGSIEEWFYSSLLGIGNIRTEHSFDEIVIKPHFAKECTWAKGSIQHPYGMIYMYWQRISKTRVEIECVIPAGATAVYYDESEQPLKQTLLGSGKHTFVVRDI